MRKIQLSILDQSQIRRGSNAREAIQESSALVRLADELGYTRYWVSEHHNIVWLAGSTPEVLIAHLAGESKRIRVGSGGIMLPNHSTLKVAENFRMLETIFPNRIDLGIGRAPGGDRITAYLLNPSNQFKESDFIQQLADLKSFLKDDLDMGGTHGSVTAIPQTDTQPELWILTSSGGSSAIAAHYGMAVSFAQFINPYGGPEALDHYRAHFRPSPELQEPTANVGIFAFVAEEEEKVREWQMQMDHRILHIEKGRNEAMPSLEEIKEIEYTPEESARIRYNRGRMICGTPQEMQTKLLALADRYDVNELVISTIADEVEDRMNSYKILANLFDLKG
ncbi:luciferase family oxidoreductase group 1 [Chitinophaga skermanii]|uniref:Luciferase-like monooxygenase n=1 Tax=Chitinophaga skermanii TaxID=331697 RepID=A0A327QLZ0_9BACT|nr:LLM class flavin-dependent oxidoreductase [Chitinophaga skermanii]RAJ05038.1 luciferase family oxidoreductase group 1 [Chitinophaga skermanii]